MEMSEQVSSEPTPSRIGYDVDRSSPLLSVVVPAFNAEKTLRGCLSALVSQEFPQEQYEVIVVDNGSSDGTWAIVQSYRPAVHGLQETTAQGSYAARNAGVRTSRGRLIAFTDADCVPDPKWLRCLVEKFANPSLGAVAGEILPFDTGTPAEKFAAQTRMLSQSKTRNHPYRPYAITANVAFRREVFEEIGLFHSGLKSGGDADLCWRMQAQTGWELAFTDAAIVLHHHRTSWRELWKQFVRYGEGNAALQALYTDYREPLLPSAFRSARRLLILVGYACGYLAGKLVHRKSRSITRETLDFAFYDFIRNIAFTFGKLRGSPAKFLGSFKTVEAKGGCFGRLGKSGND
jgi:cellulose synthase/poly-beta-1,6-N-acetylglucosamine synthase-like glycosyltransferase